jgi:hypothetical protein
MLSVAKQGGCTEDQDEEEQSNPSRDQHSP